MPPEYDGAMKTLGKQGDFKEGVLKVNIPRNKTKSIQLCRLCSITDSRLRLSTITFFESPRIFYMHVHGHGKAADLAKMAKPAVDLIGKGSPKQQSSVTGGTSNISAGQIDTAKIAMIAGHDREQTGAV
jgi:hypothetical protein